MSADPFADIPGVVVVKESKKVTGADSPFSVGPLDAYRSISQSFPKPMQAKAEADLLERIDSEKKIYEKLQELHAVRERLYQLRFDCSRDAESVRIDVQNHIKELARIEAGLNRLRQQSLQRFTESLHLADIGIDLSAFVASLQPKTGGAATAASASASASAASSSNEERIAEPLMRTKSTQTLRDKPPSEKWAGLFRMFREWKHQHQVAEATHIVGRKDTILENEIAKLRAAVYTLKQKKELSEGDKQLLLILQKKLEVCTNVYLNEAGGLTSTPSS